MSNPLLRPGDPRFVRQSIVDAEGKKAFAESETPATNPAGTGSPTTEGGNLYSASSEATPYQPHYELSQSHRGRLLIILAILGLAFDAVGIASPLGLLVGGWMLAALGIVPSACAWLLGMQDLRAMKLGAMDPAGCGRTRLAMWLGGLGVFGSVGMVVLMVAFAIYFAMRMF